MSLWVFLIASFKLFPLYASSNESVSKPIAKGEKLAVKVLEQEELNGAYIVSGDGTLEFPLIPDMVKAQGLTYDELAQSIKEKLEGKFFYRATVIVAPYRAGDSSSVIGITKVSEGGVVYIYGAVRGTGAMPIPRDEVFTVSKVLIRCGGFGDFSDKQKIKLIRRSPATGMTETKILNMVNVIEKGRLDQDVEVRDGDLIVVPEKFFNF